MRWIKAIMDNEAVVGVAIITALANLGMAFGLDLTGEQVGAINALLVAVGALLARALVWSESSVDQARSSAWVAGFKERHNTAEALRRGIDGHDRP